MSGMTEKEKKEKVVLFQGSNYRVLAMDRYNVMLEILNSEGNYKFVGYYTSTVKALQALIRQDLLMDRMETRDIKEYLNEIQVYKEKIMNDIEAHFSAEDDELFN